MWWFVLGSALGHLRTVGPVVKKGQFADAVSTTQQCDEDKATPGEVDAMLKGI